MNLEDFGVDRTEVTFCKTCNVGPQSCAIFESIVGIEVTLCHSCLVDLANLVFEADAARPTDPKPSRTQGGFVSVTEKK